LPALVPFYFLRRLGAAGGSSFAGGLLYMASGTFTWFGNLEQMANVAMMIPLLLWSFDRALVSGLRRSLPVAVAAVALVLVAGQPETAVYVLALATGFTLVATWERAGLRGLPPVAVSLAGVGLLGLVSAFR